jgi:membrane-associated protease RseP (regulator of RpoE activity)
LAEIDSSDLNLFTFDYDLTMMVFFLTADEQILGRYGGRDSSGPDSRQSLAGLRYSMQAALLSHQQAKPANATEREDPRFVRDFRAARSRNRCTHCHEVKELANDEIERSGKWSRDLLWRYPLPDNLGLFLEVDRGNVVEQVEPDSPAAEVGLKKGDVLQTLDGLPVNSLGDAQFALDSAPKSGKIEVSWRRDGNSLVGILSLPDGWRRGDISWRPSMMHMIPSARLYGRDLKPEERKQYGLSDKQLAFWQKRPIHKQAQAAGIQENDIILGFDGKQLKMDAYDFLKYVRQNYVVGEQVIINLIRDGNRLNLPMTLQEF